jgi:putative ABC transport system permease protein
MSFLIAWRNVFRNRRRTAFSLTVVVVGTAVFLFVLAYIGEALQSSRATAACETGAVQVADARLFAGETKSYDYLIAPDIQARVLNIVARLPGVLGTGLELDFAGLIGDANGSSLIIGRGLTPCDCVEGGGCYAIQGKTLSEVGPRDVILGKRLAAKLGVGIGDVINVATGTASGNFNAASATVAGEVSYSLQTVEEELGLFPLAFSQRLLKTDGVARILIGLQDLGQAPQFASALTAALAAEGVPLAVRTWEDLSSGYGSLKTFYTAFSGLTISFLERTREVGTVRALGATRRRVFEGFLLEGSLIGMLGATIGAALGSGATLLFNAIGFAWTPPGAAVPQAIRLELALATVLVPWVTVIAATLASSIYPAWKNARQQVVRALQSIRRKGQREDGHEAMDCPRSAAPVGVHWSCADCSVGS